MALNRLDSGRIVLSNAEYFHVTPYVNEDTIGDVTYDIVNIVADTLSLTPDDNTVNAKEWEFGDTPLFENITLGKIQFAATCIDFQNEVLKHMFGWEELGGALVAPNSYRDLYAVVEIGFKNEDVKVVVPKLKLNSKAIISTLKTGTGEGNLAGTAYNAFVNVGGVSKNTPMALLDGSIEEYSILGKSFEAGNGIGSTTKDIKIALAAFNAGSTTGTNTKYSTSLTASGAASNATYTWSDGSTGATLSLSNLDYDTTYTYTVVARESDVVVGSKNIIFTTPTKVTA